MKRIAINLLSATIYERAISSIFILMSIGIYGTLTGQITTLMVTIKENKKLGYNGTSFTGHAVIMGWNDFAGPAHRDTGYGTRQRDAGKDVRPAQKNSPGKSQGRIS